MAEPRSSADPVPHLLRRETPPTWLSLAIVLVAALGLQVLWPGERLTSLESQQRWQAARVDTLSWRFEAHVLSEQRKDSALVARIDKVLIGECLDRSARELNLMNIPCDSLLRIPRDLR